MMAMSLWSKERLRTHERDALAPLFDSGLRRGVGVHSSDGELVEVRHLRGGSARSRGGGNSCESAGETDVGLCARRVSLGWRAGCALAEVAPVAAGRRSGSGRGKRCRTERRSLEDCSTRAVASVEPPSLILAPNCAMCISRRCDTTRSTRRTIYANCFNYTITDKTTTSSLHRPSHTPRLDRPPASPCESPS